LDSKVLCPRNNYVFASINKYLDTGVQVQLTTQISNNCVLGVNCKVGVHTVIEKSSIGKNCKIGKNVVIKNAFIWNDVEI
jgi:translation initiation factor eIF-2B subunit epsilon